MFLTGTEGKLDRTLMKQSNRRLVFSVIHRNGAISRAEIAKLSGLSAMSVGRIVDDLICLGAVVEAESGGTDSQMGRKPKSLSITPDSFCSVGIEIGGEGVDAGVINFEGRVIRRIHCQAELKAMPVPEALKTVAGTIREIFAESGDLPIISTAGIVCPGWVDNGVVRFSKSLQWENVDILSELRKMTGIGNLAIDSEAKARAVAEDLFGLGKNCETSVVLHIGSDIGSAAMIRHSLYRGRENRAGNIGHICVEPDGNPCDCGRRGCLQTVLSENALLRQARIEEESVTLTGMLEACEAGVPWAVNLVERALKSLFTAIEILAGTYAPEVIILCGRVIEESPSLAKRIFEMSEGGSNPCRLEVSGFGSFGNVIGAGALGYYFTKFLW